MVRVGFEVNADLIFVTDRKLSSNAESAVKRREPGILKLAKTYNDLCTEMQTLARRRKASRNVALPQLVDVHKLFALDVDDEIWQDVGLDEDDDGAAPLWLTDTKTRKGIQHLLMVDRCIEEEARLKKEQVALQEWMCEEWSTLERACTSTAGVLTKRCILVHWLNT
jgi:hypothetical protein